jgi:hypothetical protein
VATGFRALLQSRRDGGPRGVVERALQALEAAALRTIETFNAQNVANTLHIMAKTCYRPWDRTLVPELEGRAEALAGTFNTQNVANTLWAYAKMGREPGAGVMMMSFICSCRNKNQPTAIYPKDTSHHTRLFTGPSANDVKK